MPHDVFISYSSIDKQAAFAACAVFEQNGIRCWIAPRDVAAGAEWAEEIINAIESAKIMVLIFSGNSNESRQVRREIELAVSRNLTIMPLRLEQIEPTRSMAYFMAGVHWIDALSPPLETHFKKMVEWIKPHIKGSGAPPPEPLRPDARTPPPPPPRADVKQPAIKAKRKGSSIFGDILFEFFGVGAKQGGIRINEAGKAISAARALADAGKRDEAIAAYHALIDRIEDANVPNLDWNLSIALLNLAITLKDAGRREEALTAYRNVVRSVGDIADELVEKPVAAAMNNHANLLMDMGRAREAVVIVDDVVARWGDTINTDLAEQVAVARLRRGLAFSAMGRHGEAIAAYDELIDQTNLKVWPKFEHLVAKGLVNKGIRESAMDRKESALLTYYDAASRFAASRDAEVREQVAKALANAASELFDLKRYDEAIAMSQTVIDGPRDTPLLIEMTALTMRNKVVALRDARRKPEAIAAADKMLAEFGNSSDPAIAGHVAAVRRIKAGL
jgi:tetratricopeptide (TPR) repeat protein